MASPSYHGSGALVPLFIFIHTFVWIGSSIIILTAVLSSKVRRHPTWVNLKLSWILACFSFALLFTTGQLYKPEPKFWICLVQAAAVYSVPMLTSGTSLALAIYLYLVVCRKDDRGEVRQSTVVALVCAPYVLPTIAFFSMLAMGSNDRSSVGLSKNWMVCGVRGPAALTEMPSICVVIILVPTIIIEGLTIASVYKRRRSYGNSIVFTLIRLSIFTMFGLFGVIVSFWFARVDSPYLTALGNVLASIPPLSFIFLFGLQKDIVKAWVFWRSEPSISGFAEIHSTKGDSRA